MSCIDFIFFKHPREVNMTYTEHCMFSCNLGGKFFCASIQACIHGLFPCLFRTSSTDYADDVNKSLNHL